MKLAIVCCVSAMIFVAFEPCPIEAASRGPQVQRVSGPSYVRLADWARSHDFELRWLKKDETLQLTRQSARLLFTVDSSEADVNGVGVRLLFPVAIREGMPCLSQLDVQT